MYFGTLNPRYIAAIQSLIGYGWNQLLVHPPQVLWHMAFGYLGLGGSFALYSAYVTIGATYIFTNFAVSHTHKGTAQCDSLNVARLTAHD